MPASLVITLRRYLGHQPTWNLQRYTHALSGRKVMMVAPAYSTMTCSECYARTKRLPLNERTFRCPECGYTAGRDRNAARVILAVAETGHTSVEALSRLKTSLKTQAA